MTTTKLTHDEKGNVVSGYIQGGRGNGDLRNTINNLTIGSPAGTGMYPQPKDTSSRLKYEQVFCPVGKHWEISTEWHFVDVQLKNAKGDIIFEQKDVRAPKTWSQRAVCIAAQKYFRGVQGTPQRENSISQLIGRVLDTIKKWCQEQDYFAADAYLSRFINDLGYLLVHQYGSFNSPVWFNLGVEGRLQQASACFINSVEDNMESIAALQTLETSIFKQGSGSGVNLSNLRGSKESLSSGGIASGPVSFAKGYDAWAGAIKSGGSTRRAAAMRILNIDHPDIVEFIRCKMDEEEKIQKLIDAGFSADFDDPQGAYSMIHFQNANHSVRVTNYFMEQLSIAKQLNNAEYEWQLVSPKTGAVVGGVPILELWDLLCKAAWRCGDPGIQFDTTTNNWNTTPVSGRIHSTNPCLHKGTRLLTSKGWQKVEDLVDQEDVSLFNGFMFEPGKVWKTGKKRIIRLHTNNGRSIDVTADHLFLTEHGYQEAAKCEGLQVPYLLTNVTVEKGLNRLPKCITGGSGKYYATASCNLMETLGFVQGDGGFNESSRVLTVYFTEDKDLRFLKETVIPLLSDIAANKEEFDYTPSLANNKAGYVFCRTKLWDWLLNLGVSIKPLPERRFPEFIWTVTKTAQRSFLRGLFGANGNICNQARDAIVLVSSCKEMLQDAQLLLQTQGISSAVRIHNKEQDVEWENGVYTSKESYHLEITHLEDRNRFAQIINFPQTCQKEKLKTIISLDEVGTKTTAELKRLKMHVTQIEDLNIEDDVYDFNCPTTAMGFAEGLIVHNCSEFAYLDNTACNLASLNLMKFHNPSKDTFEWGKFCNAIEVFIIAQDALVNKAHYPSQQITENSKTFRPLGLGYTNLGAYLMSQGIPYDSEKGRRLAANITATMTGQAYLTSTKLAKHLGAFDAYAKNENEMMEVIKAHRAETRERIIEPEVAQLWDSVVEKGAKYGFRNAQVTLLAPTGTISFMMDCDTTGIEPALGLYTVKQLVGGGNLTTTNPAVERGLKKLGYKESVIRHILAYLHTKQTVVGCSYLKQEHLPIFDCAFEAKGRMLSLDAHLDMTAAVQPFLSGAISKTMNLAHTATVEDVSDAFRHAWNLGIKNITVYRDGCKSSQPLTTKKETHSAQDEPPVVLSRAAPVIARKKLKDHQTNVHRMKFSFGQVKGYLLVTPFEDTGMPGELFIEWSKEGSTISGLVDGWAQSMSYNLQYGVPLETLVSKFSHTKFEPSGWSPDPDIRHASSIYDAIMRKLAAVFLEHRVENGFEAPLENITNTASRITDKQSIIDAPICTECGTLMQRVGATCYTCAQCGTSSGCG